MNRSLLKRGVPVVVSGPSGAGKSTVCRELLAREPEMHFSVSCTTRPARPGETDGAAYYFLSRAQFEARLAADGFLEHAEVHGNYYGTPRSEVTAPISAGRDVLLDVDVQGARSLRHNLDAAVSGAPVFIFIAPPSLVVLEQRLRGRGTESEETIQRRLANARVEVTAWREYDFLVINDDVAAAVTRLQAILTAARCATSRQQWTPG
jgi:guanylate kinase